MGMDLDEDKKETKLFKGIIEAIENLSNSFTDLDEDLDSVVDQLEVIDEDLSHVEKKVYGDCCDCDCDCCDCDCCDDDCDCGDCCRCSCDDEDTYEVVCPTCHEKICIGEETLDKEQMHCPNCGELLEFDLDDCECDCCGCDCSDDDCDCDDDCTCGCHEGSDITE